MAHISGLVVTGEASSPFEYCDVVTTTTHKSLRGPRSGMIFFKKDERKFDAKINFAVFPMLQVGGGDFCDKAAAPRGFLRQAAAPLGFPLCPSSPSSLSLSLSLSHPSFHPPSQGGPHEHQIAAVATQLKEAMTPEFKQYIQQVKKNAQSLAKALMDKGHVLATGGTENHLILWDLRPHGVTGSKMEKMCDLRTDN